MSFTFGKFQGYHLGTCSFICQGTSTRRKRNDLFNLRVKLPPATTLFFSGAETIFGQKRGSRNGNKNKGSLSKKVFADFRLRYLAQKIVLRGGAQAPRGGGKIFPGGTCPLPPYFPRLCFSFIRVRNF